MLFDCATRRLLVPNSVWEKRTHGDFHMILEPWYVTGLIDGEGCFSVSFSLLKRLNIQIETRPSFSVSLNERDLPLLKKVHAFFSCGAIRYSNTDRTYKYEVRAVSDLTKKIIPHFKKYKLHGAKLNDFNLFEEICRSVRANHHLNKKYLVEIIEKAYLMNPSGKRKHTKFDLLKVLDEIMV